MGELNASHLGVGGGDDEGRGRDGAAGPAVDESYRGKGLKIAEVLKRGPADQRGLNLKAGRSRPGHRRQGDHRGGRGQHAAQRQGQGKRGVLQVAAAPDAEPKARRRVEIQASGKRRIQELIYDRWVEKNARRVAELSKGKLGYIHIPRWTRMAWMRSCGALYSDNFDKDAIVLDVRYNAAALPTTRC